MKPGRRKKLAAPAFSTLDDHERSAVLTRLLQSHPELGAETEALATELLTTVSASAIADEVASVLRDIPTEHLAVRAGRQPGRGYVEPDEAAWELVEETLEPFLADLRRLGGLGFIEAAATSAAGVLLGLRQLDKPKDGTVLAYAGEDTATHLAEQVIAEAAKLSIELPDDLVPDQ